MTHRTPRIDRFLNEVNKRYFNNDPKHLEELFSVYDSIPEEKNTCIVLMKSGPKKGTACGKACVTNQMCGLHSKNESKNEKKEVQKEVQKEDTEEIKEEMKEKKPKKSKKEIKESDETSEETDKETKHCEFLLKTGANKGNMCGKKKSDDCEWCPIHMKSKQAEKKKEEKKQEPEEKITFCQAQLKNGSSCTNKTNGETFCKTHIKSKPEEDTKHTLRVKRDGERYLIKGSNVMFDLTRQCIIGFKRGDEYVLEENDETKEMCERYKLSFE
jgi:hypothetical protein